MIWNQFLLRVAKDPRKIAVLADNESISYAELAGLAVRMAKQLPTHQPGSPNRVLIQQSSPLAVLVSVLACWSSGFVPVVLRDGMTVQQVDEIAEWLHPVAVLSDFLPIKNSIPSFEPSSQSLLFQPREEALVICTSGTTGTPKLVALPAESVCINADTIGRSLGLQAHDIVAVNTPLGYMYGLMGGCMASLWAGAACTLFSPKEPLTQLQAAIRRERITVVQGPPTLFRLFLAYWNGKPFSEVRLFTTGGETIMPGLLEDMAKAFPSARGLFLYGMTEAGPRVADKAVDSGGGVRGCFGMPYPHVEWKIAPVEGISASGVGRLLLRGPTIFLGYIKSNGGYEGLDDEGFFPTQDLVSVDASGQLAFQGRLDRLFKSGGKLVNPDMVEHILCKHPSIEDAHCFTESHPILGLVPCAEIIPTNGANPDDKEIREFCHDHLERHAIPHRFVLKMKREMTQSGKRCIST